MTDLKSLQALLEQMDTIEGTTEAGRHFRIKYNGTNGFDTQIFSSEGDVYEPCLRMHDVRENNILSTINKMDEIFFDKRMYQGRPTKTKRKRINIVGSQDGDGFSIAVQVDNNWVGGRLFFHDSNHSITMDRDVPEHIHAQQKHDWLFLHYQKPESWTDILKFCIKENYYSCCGNNILGKYMYCHTCGKKQEVNNLVITEVIPIELLTLLS